MEGQKCIGPRETESYLGHVLVGARIRARNVIPDKLSRKSLARRQSEIINRLSDRTSIAVCVTRVTARANVIVNTVLIYRLIGEITAARYIYIA